jgi:hypothetical protein
LKKTKEGYNNSNGNETSNNPQQAEQKQDEPRAIKMAKGLQHHKESRS